MTSPMLELQSAIIARLRADAAVTAIVGQKSFDRVPADRNGNPTVEAPYISLGPSDELSDDAECVEAYEITMQIDAWSREPGFPQVRQIADAVRRVLKPELTLSSNALVTFEHRITRYLREPDGLGSHAAMTFTATVEQH